MVLVEDCVLIEETGGRVESVHVVQLKCTLTSVLHGDAAEDIPGTFSQIKRIKAFLTRLAN